MQITVVGVSTTTPGYPSERGDPGVSSTHTPVYRRPGPSICARQMCPVWCWSAIPRETLHNPSRLHIGNEDSLDAADDAGDVPHRPIVYVTDVPRE